MDCDCRKPKPGMYLEAIDELDLDAAASWCVGDSLRDLAAAKSAGIPGCVLVETGKGAKQKDALAQGDHLATDLAAAIDWILSRT